MISNMKGREHNQSPVDRFAAFVVLAVAVVLSLFALRNNDIWWLMAVGRRIVETKAFITQDPFAFTMSGSAWSPQAWLSGLIFYAVYQAWSVAGLIVLRAVLVVGMVVLTLRTIRTTGVTWPAAAPLVLLMLLTAYTRFIVRAHLFEYVFIALLLGFLLKAHERSGRSFYVIPVVLQVLWVNIHPSFLLGPVLTGLFFLGEFLSERMMTERRTIAPLHRHNYRRVVVLLALLVGACFLNPNPAMVLTQPFNAEQRELMSRFTLEWKSPFDPALVGAVFHPYYELLLAIATVVVLASLRNFSLAPVLLIAATAFMSVQSHRFRVEFALVSVPMICVLLARAPVVARIREQVAGAGRWLLPGAGAALTVFFAVLAVKGAEVSISRVDRYPDQTLHFLVDHNIAHRAFHPIGFGSFMVWELYGERQTFIDGRNPSVAVYRDFLTAQRSEEGMRLIAKKYQIDAFVLPPIETSDTGMKNIHTALSSDSTWALVRLDSRAATYLSRSAVDSLWLTDHEFVEYHPLTIADRRLDEPSLDRVIAELTRATQRVPDYFELWMHLVSARQTRGDLTGAIDAMGRARRLRPDDPVLLGMFAKLALESGNAGAAVEAYQAMTNRYPDDAVSWHQLGLAYEGAGRDEEATRAHMTAIDVDPNSQAAWQGAFRTQIRRRALDEAFQLARRLTEHAPESYLGFYYQAQLQMRFENKREAIRLAETALRKNSKAPAVHMMLAKLYLEEGRFVEALVRVESVLEIIPDNARAQRLQRELRQHLGR